MFSLRRLPGPGTGLLALFLTFAFALASTWLATFRFSCYRVFVALATAAIAGSPLAMLPLVPQVVVVTDVFRCIAGGPPTAFLLVSASLAHSAAGMSDDIHALSEHRAAEERANQDLQRRAA
jgi:hypothetical protein